MKSKYFRLFASCILVNGVRRSGICDIQRGHFETIPNSLYEILNEHRQSTYDEIVLLFGEDNRLTLDEFFNWLIEKEYGFWCDTLEELSSFPEMSLEWDSPYPIHNIIIDIDSESNFDLDTLITQIKDLRVPYIQLRSYSQLTLDYYANWMKKFDGSMVRTVDIITPYYHDCINEDFSRFSKRFIRLNSIIFYNSPDSKISGELNNLTNILFTTTMIDSHKSCGQISPEFFMVNKSLLTESLHFNNCLNRKLSLTTKGEIKNCPSMTKSFGNIANKSLKEAMSADDFRELWKINKSEIHTCNMCEYRYICTDCRAYIENPTDIYSKPLKCGYDPETAIWSDWSTNPLKEKARQYYGFDQNLIF